MGEEKSHSGTQMVTQRRGRRDEEVSGQKKFKKTQKASTHSGEKVSAAGGVLVRKRCR